MDIRTFFSPKTKMTETKTKTPEEEEEEECPGCLRPKCDDTYEEVRCVRCETEMCNECFSVSPVEGDDDVYCKRCAQDRLDEAEAEEEEFECPRCFCILRGDDANDRRMWISTDPEFLDPNDGYDVCDDCEEAAMAEEKAKMALRQ